MDTIYKIKSQYLNTNMKYVNAEYPEGVKIDIVKPTEYGLIKIECIDIDKSYFFNYDEEVSVIRIKMQP